MRVAGGVHADAKVASLGRVACGRMKEVALVEILVTVALREVLGFGAARLECERLRASAKGLGGGPNNLGLGWAIGKVLGWNGGIIRVWGWMGGILENY